MVERVQRRPKLTDDSFGGPELVRSRPGPSPSLGRDERSRPATHPPTRRLGRWMAEA